MQADRTKKRRFPATMLAVCAAWPLLAAEPVKPEVPVQQQSPAKQFNASELKRTKAVNTGYPQIALD